MKDKVLEIWPEINWIKDANLREKTLMNIEMNLENLTYMQ